MSSVVEAAALMREIAAPYAPSDRVKAAIERARERVSRQLRSTGHSAMEYGRAKRIWKKEARRIDAWEQDALRAAKAERERIRLANITSEAEAIARRNEQIKGELHNEFVRAVANFASLSQTLAHTDADYFAEDIARLGVTASRIRERLAKKDNRGK